MRVIVGMRMFGMRVDECLEPRQIDPTDDVPQRGRLIFPGFRISFRKGTAHRHCHIRVPGAVDHALCENRLLPCLCRTGDACDPIALADAGVEERVEEHLHTVFAAQLVQDEFEVERVLPCPIVVGIRHIITARREGPVDPFAEIRTLRIALHAGRHHRKDQSDRP